MVGVKTNVDGTGRYRTCTSCFHDGTGRLIQIITTGRDGNWKLSRADGGVLFFSGRDGTIHTTFHDETG